MKSAAASQVRVRRGQPLLVFGLLLAGWIGLRAVMWERIELPPLRKAVETAIARAVPSAAKSAPALANQVQQIAPASAALQPVPSPSVDVAPLPPSVNPAPPLVFGGGSSDSVRVAAAHQLAWMAGVAQLPVPRFITERLAQTQRIGGLVPLEQTRVPPGAAVPSRWSADGWLLLREGGAGATVTGLPSPTYGASQAGAVIRYRLSTANRHQPALYLRVSSAVQRPRGEEAALGVSARPLAQLPVAVQVELRATQQVRGTTLRPAISAVSGLPRLDLPAGFLSEFYGQAGFVGGPDSTAFADAQVRIERRIARLGRGELRAGLGAWGGAQKGAGRLDIGPTATIDFALGAGQGRVSADWRLRTSGNAAPQSGPALTLSAGF